MAILDKDLTQMRLLLFIILGIVLIGCSVSESSEDVRPNEFDIYIKSLNKIDLPMQYSSNHFFVTLSAYHFDKVGFEKYKQIWAEYPYGLLSTTEEFVLTADLVVNDKGNGPIFMTYDLLGNKIDSLNPFDKAGSDMGYEAIEYITVQPDLTFLVIDTVWKYDLDTKNNEINIENPTITTGKVFYNLNKNGQFTELNT